MKYQLPKTAAEAARLIAQCQFKPFDEQDRELFGGCETEDPKVYYLGDDVENGLAVVQDGSTFHFEMQNEDGITVFTQFSLSKGFANLV